MTTTRKIRRVSKGHAEGTSLEEAVEVEEGTDLNALVPPEVAQRIVDAEKKVDEVSRRIKQISDDSARAIGKAVQVSDELETLKNETLENMQVAFDENAEILEAIEKDVSELKSRMGDDKLKTEIAERLASLEGARDSVSADVKMLKSEGESLRKNVQSMLDQKMPEIDQKIAGGLSKAETAAGDALQKATSAEKQLADTLHTLKQLGADGASLGAALAGIVGRQKELAEKVQKGEVRAEEADLKILELEEARKTSNVDRQVADLAAQVEALNARLASELEKAKASYAEVESTLKAANGALERTTEASSQVEALQGKLASAEEQMNTLVVRLSESSAVADANRDRVGLAFKLVEDVEDKIRRVVAPVDDALALIEDFENMEGETALDFELNDLLDVMIKHGASDLHLKVGAPPTVRLEGDLVPVGNLLLTETDCKRLIFAALSKTQRRRLLERRELDFAYAIPRARFRVNVFLQRGTVSAAFRMLRQEMPSLEELGLPQVLKKLSSFAHGLILVTGPAGAGKSTTLASIIDYINKNEKKHIITVEDPIEFVHRDIKSLITQREVGSDTQSFNDALKQALRQDPNVLLIGEMRDAETILTAVMAAETGHLVLSTLHTPNAVQAIDRIVDAFTGEQQKQFRMLLANTLRGVVSQRLLNRADGPGRVPAVEVMVVTPTISSLILEGKTPEIYPYIQQGSTDGMQTFTQSLTRLYESGLISKDEALYHADQPTEFRLGVEGHSTGTSAYSEGDTLMNWL